MEAAESDIAIVGMAGRFPNAPDLDAFWRNLRDGFDSVVSLTDEELLAAGVAPALLTNPNYVKSGAFLDDVDLFDNDFFGFTPRDAALIDPQQRVFLECAWEAVESAGYDPSRYRGAIGVFAGVTLSSYLITLYSNRSLLSTTSNFQLMIGNDKDYLPTRVSYKLDLRGPSVTVQTACSTSLVAVHMACQSLLSGESHMALAGAASIPIPQRRGYLYQEGSIMSPDGRCRAFDAEARGTIGGTGVGIVLLKRLVNALNDGDMVHAVIKGSAINNDGAAKVGYTAPSVKGQAHVISEALAMADVEPETVTYVEAHGTGTTLGDPIEIAALTKVFGACTTKKNFCAIGSVKTNIGHLDVAAGMAGLIKTVLALKHKQLPPSLNFTRPNPKIDFANSPFFVNATLREWEAGKTPRRAGVSSFGIGGTNAHVVVEEAPAPREAGESRTSQLLVWSARTQSALEKMTDGLANYLQKNPGVNVADVCYTLSIGRKTFDHRRMLVCRDGADAWGALAVRDAARVLTQVQKPRAREVVFMFPGQGAPRVNMGRWLYRSEAIFRKHIDRCAEILITHLGLDLRTALYPAEDQTEAAEFQLKQTAVTQPALFVTEYALAQLWSQWGVRPAAMIGHSLGEYVAACLAGVLSLEDALALVAARGTLMQSLPPGAMLAVPLGEDEARLIVNDGNLSLACVNGPRECVISGTVQKVKRLEKRLTTDGVACRRLKTSHAFHSAMTDPILDDFSRVLNQIKLRPPEIPYVSNLTGDWIKPEEVTDPSYWTRHLRETVRFSDGLSRLLAEPEHVFVEAGPGLTLCIFLKRHPEKSGNHVAVASLPEGNGDELEQAALLKALGQLWQAGVELNWDGYFAGERRRRVNLPTYPFERQRCWIDAELPPPSHTDNGHRVPAPISAAERLLLEQLKIMTQQLEVLRLRH